MEMLKVVEVSGAPLLQVKDKRLVRDLFRMSLEWFSMKSQQGLEREAATLWSLYRQMEYGDAEEFENNKTSCTELQ
mgnify:FL=1